MKMYAEQTINMHLHEPTFLNTPEKYTQNKYMGPAITAGPF